MISKIATHEVSVVAQNKKDRARVLGIGARSKSKRHSPPASPFRQLHQRAHYFFGEAVENSTEYLYSRLCRTLLEKPSQTAVGNCVKTCSDQCKIMESFYIF